MLMSSYLEFLHKQKQGNNVYVQTTPQKQGPINSIGQINLSDYNSPSTILTLLEEGQALRYSQQCTQVTH